MLRYTIVCSTNGILFGILDALINANPYAQKLLEIYKPLAKNSINVPAGLFIDLIYGFVVGFLFLLTYKSLPGKTGLTKGISFALIVWFFRVIMNVASTWMTLNVPALTLIYIAATGLLEMIVLGIIYGLFLRPSDV